MNQQETEHDQVLHLAGDLRILTGKLRRRMREGTQQGDITMSQSCVLNRLEREGPSTVSSLARAEGMRPQSMAATVQALLEAQMVAGSPDPSDKRQTIVSLTDSCRAWMKQSRAAREDWLARTIESRLAPQEVLQLQQAMLLLQRLAD